jgi:hypothetical protein
MSIEGDLSQLNLAHVLESVAAQGKSGILTVQGADDIVAVSFLEGAVVSADALNQTVEDGLGAVLESRNQVQAKDFAALSREHQGGSTGSLGDLLVSRGLIDRDELLQALRIQTYQLLLQILVWKDGEFKFYEGDEISFEEGFQPLPVEEVLVRSIDDLKGQGGLQGPVPEDGLLYRTLPPREAVKVFGQDGDGIGEGIWITKNQAGLMNRLDGKTQVSSAATSLGMEGYSTVFALHKLLRHRLIETSGSVAQAATSKAARRSAPKPSGRPRSAPSPALTSRSATPLKPPSSAAMPGASVEQTPPLLKADILVPPGDEETPYFSEDIAPPAAQAASSLHQFIGPVLAVALLFALVLTFLPRPGLFLMPFPWQKNQRDAVYQHLRQTLFGKIEQANRSYFLVQAHYPDSMQELVDLGLLTAGDLRDPAAYVLSYANGAVGYRITLLEEGETVEGLGAIETLRNDFLLNPRFLRTSPSEGVPLVLLD